MVFKIKQVQDVAVIDADGELSRSNMQALDDVLCHLTQSERHNVVLNLAGLKHLDYRLVQSISQRIRQFQLDGGDLKMANASRYVREIMTAMGLEEEMHATVEDALLDFLQGEPHGDIQ